MNCLEQESFALLTENGRRLEPVSREMNRVGLCDRCESDLESLAYHRTESGWMVSARCKKDHFVLMRYDLQWNWLGDQELQISAKEKGTSSISSVEREKLEAVFTSAEIRDMLACESGQPFTRQNLYRARAKYEKFEKLFGIKINI